MIVFSFPFPGMLVDRFDNHGLALYLTGGLLLSSTVIEVFLRKIMIFSQILSLCSVKTKVCLFCPQIFASVANLLHQRRNGYTQLS